MNPLSHATPWQVVATVRKNNINWAMHAVQYVGMRSLRGGYGMEWIKQSGAVGWRR